mgnify:CR=1 FL=1
MLNSRCLEACEQDEDLPRGIKGPPQITSARASEDAPHPAGSRTTPDAIDNRDAEPEVPAPALRLSRLRSSLDLSQHRARRREAALERWDYFECVPCGFYKCPMPYGHSI